MRTWRVGRVIRSLVFQNTRGLRRSRLVPIEPLRITEHAGGIEGEILTRDMWKQAWAVGLSKNYDAIATANALNWFHVACVVELFKDVFRLLRPGGVFAFLEPASAEAK